MFSFLLDINFLNQFIGVFLNYCLDFLFPFQFAKLEKNSFNVATCWSSYLFELLVLDCGSKGTYPCIITSDIDRINLIRQSDPVTLCQITTRKFINSDSVRLYNP